MIKKFVISLIAFLTIFLTQSPVWASNQNAGKIQQTITIERPVFFTNQPPYLLADNISLGKDLNVWVLSILIPGLGQMIMGDILRGLKFPLIMAAGVGLISFLFLGGIVSVGGGDNAYGIKLISVFLYSVALILPVYIWNIIDAYNMAQEEPETNLEKRIYFGFEFAEKIKISDKGAVSVKIFAF
jgi:TM2 domain-containing membrane protein YozV